MQNCTALIQPLLAFARHGEQIGDIVIYIRIPLEHDTQGVAAGERACNNVFRRAPPASAGWDAVLACYSTNIVMSFAWALARAGIRHETSME
jgi:hypothetical protein